MTPKNNGVPEIASYEVSTGFYSLISYSLVSSAISGTQNYNPLGSSQFSFPTNAPGTVAPLQPGNTTIDTTNTYPYCAVGRNELPAPGGGSYISSSYLVGSNLIASAAHVFAENGRIVPNIDDFHIYFGKQGSSYAASASVSKIWFSLSFLYESSNGPYDWAIAKLTSSPGATVGHLGIQKSSSLTLTTNSNLVIDGYYGGLEYQSLSYANFIYDEGNSVIRYTASTAGGDSGAPVCHVGNNRVIGLHTGRAGTSYSCGTLFTDERFSLAYQILGGDIS